MKSAKERRSAGLVEYEQWMGNCFPIHHPVAAVYDRIFRSHAASNAALMFTSGPSHGEAIGAYQGEPLYHASLDEAEYRALLADQGFHVVAHAVEDPKCGDHTIWLAQLNGELI